MKQTILDLIAKQVLAVEDGDANALELLANLKAISKEIDLCITQVMPEAMTELNLHPKAKYEGFGAKFEIRNSATRYTYSHLPNVSSQALALKELQDQAKAAYKLSLKGQQLVTADGEVIAPAECTGGKETIFITSK